MSDKAKFTVVTPVAFLSYPWLDVPQPADEPGGKDKYGAALVFPKGSDLKPLEQAVIAAAVKRFGEGAVAQLKAGRLHNPLRNDPDDVREKKYPEGSTFTGARSEQRPGFVYLYADPATGKPMIVPPEKIKSEFYAGAMVKAQVTAFGFDRKGKKGVGLGLNNLPLVDGTTPRWDGRDKADDAFEAEGELQPADLSDLEGGA